MRSEDYVQSEHADLWLSDNYLRWGVESILEHIAFGNTAIRYVFLSENQYLDVLKHNYDRGSSKIILLTDGAFSIFLMASRFISFPWIRVLKSCRNSSFQLATLTKISYNVKYL